MSHDPWPSDWLRGALGVCVLRILADGPTYGYAIASRLEDAGMGNVKGGTLYPLLTRFEAAGLVEIDWRPGEGGPGRKFYALTELGRRHTETQVEQWIAFTRTTRALMHTGATSERTRA